MRYWLTLALLVITTVPTHAKVNADQWVFEVFLGDQYIGEHRFIRERRVDSQLVKISANFNVKFWVFNAYSYQHKNVEQWSDGCLKSINSTTNDNGDLLRVDLEFKDRFAMVNSYSELDRRDFDCVKSFAYWDISILKETHLLNAQTGEYMAITVEDRGQERAKNGEEIMLRHYRLSTTKFDIDLWYDKQNRWVGLVSTTEDGNKLRYVSR